jgi:xylulokinase
MVRFLGLDLGTSHFKGAVLDLDRHAISYFRSLPTPAPISGPPTRHELDPAAILATVRTLLGELLHDAPDAAGLVVCGQMHGLVLTDKRGGPMSDVATWKDQRVLEPTGYGSVTYFDNLKVTVTAGELDDIGGELRVGVPVTTLFRIRQDGWLKAGRFAASLPDFVLANLCGVEPTTEATNAAAHGLYHLDGGDWHRGLIAKLKLGALRWPRILPFGEIVGVVEIDGRKLTCFTPVGDQQCALLGAGLVEGELSLNISTGSQVSLISRDRPRGEFLVRPYFDGRWLRTIVSVPAGRSLSGLVDLLTEMSSTRSDAWEYIRDAVDRVPETDLEMDLSFFPSFGGDHGRIANIREGNLTVGHLFAAAFRSMAANYSRAATVLSPGHEWDRVVFSGGLARRFPRLRREILAALGNPPSRVSEGEEETMQGLLALAERCASRLS